MSKIRTIQRRKGWPAWARWYVRTEPGGGFVCSGLPRANSNGGWYDDGLEWASAMVAIRPPRRHWRTSLRRIVARKAGKGKAK